MKEKCFIFGLSGKELTAEEKELFTAHEDKIFGFILFGRNINTEKQLKNLTHELKSLYNDDPPLIFIDQEGGRVARLKPPIIEQTYPPAKSFANTYQTNKDEAVKEAKLNYKKLMQDLREFSLDSPCAPVADWSYPETHDVIGDRSFGNDVKKIVELASSAIDGIIEEKGIPVIKHIPGHGRATSDSHLGLPKISTSLEELEKSDFAVFKALAKKADYAMTAHIVFEALDENLPVTLSKKAINYIRNEIGFKGKIMTDAIEMHALHHGVDITTAKNYTTSLVSVAKNSLAAGCDIVLHCTGDLEQMQAILLNT